MNRNRTQKEYVIHQIKGSRSPQPLRKFNHYDSNENDETESDDEYIPSHNSQTNIKDTKNLVLGKVEDYALINTSKNIRLEANTNKISSFIIKEDLTQEDKFFPKTIRSPLRNVDYQRKPNANLSYSKYPVRYSNRKSSNDKDADELIYVKKRIAVAPTESNNDSRFNYDSKSTTSNKKVIHHHTFLEEELESPQIEDEIIEEGDNDYFNCQALKIQTAWRGYNLRLHLFQNLNIFYQTHRAIAQLEHLLHKKQKRFFWKRFTCYFYYLKKVYIKNNLNLTKIPKIYHTKEIMVNLGLRIYRKELSESFQFLRKKQGGKVNTAKDYQTLDLQFINYQEKYKIKVLRQLFILKLRKENYTLKNAFQQLQITGMRASINKIKKQTSTHKQQLLKSILKNKINKSNQIFKKSFMKLYFRGTLDQVKASLLKSNELLKKSQTIDKNKLLHKIVTSKKKGNKTCLKEYFMKLYYNGLFKVMNCLPQKKMEDPKIVLSRKLRKMVYTKESNREKTLKLYLLRLYYGGILHAYKSNVSATPRTKEPISILTDSNIIDSVQTPKRESQTTKEKRMTMRQLVKSKKKGATDNLRKAFWKFYFTGIFGLMKTSGKIQNRTNPNCLIKTTHVSTIDLEIQKKKKDDVKALLPIQKDERKKLLKPLIVKINKSNESRLKNVFTIYALKCSFLKNQKLREAKIKSLVIKKDSDIHRTLVNSFTKYNLKAKLMRVKEILNKNKRRRKKRQQGNKSNPQLKHSNNPSDLMPESIEGEDDDDDYDDDLSIENDIDDSIPEIICSQPLRSKPQSRFKKTNDQDEDEVTISKSNMKLMIKKHIKLMNIIDNENNKYLFKYFAIWLYPTSMRNSEKEIYKAAFFNKIISNLENKIKLRYLKTRFNQWKKGNNDLTKNIKSTLAITKLSKIIKKITYQLYFKKFFCNYINYLKYCQLRKVVNNMEMRIVRMNNKHLRNRFYILGNKKPVQMSFASSVITMRNSCQTVSDLVENIQKKRYMRIFYFLLSRKVAWEKPLNINIKVRKVTYYLKNGQVVYSTNQNETARRNFFWRFRNPKKYYFRKYFSKVMKIKEKELEMQSRKWEYEVNSPIEGKKNSSKKSKK